MDEVRVLADAAAVEVALDPVRASILDALTEPGSATTVAAAIGSTRQKVNYHLKALEAHGLVELAEERAWGGCRCAWTPGAGAPPTRGVIGAEIVPIDTRSPTLTAS